MTKYLLDSTKNAPIKKKHFIKSKCTFLAPLFTESGKARFSKISLPFVQKNLANT